MKKKIGTLYTVIVVVLIIGGMLWVVGKFRHSSDVEFTDNAYVRQHITPVNARVPGFIKEIRFKEFQPVKKGDTLVIIEDAEFQLHVAEAQAALATAQAGHRASEVTVATMQSNIGVTEAAIQEAKAVLDNAGREERRFAAMLAKNAVTQQQYDEVNTAYIAAEAHYRQLEQSRNSTALVKNETSHRNDQNDAAVRLAEAQLQLARLNLSYTVVTAPCDGYLSRKDINAGQLVQPGQLLVDIIDSTDIWVVANYRETQIKHIVPGAKVEMEVDAVPGVIFRGIVESVSDATGSAVSMLPTDNATGNFVKVEQRVPVRIAFDSRTKAKDLARLRAGMSVECEVSIK